jgi:nicotinamide-nucleotide amidase
MAIVNTHGAVLSIPQPGVNRRFVGPAVGNRTGHALCSLLLLERSQGRHARAKALSAVVSRQFAQDERLAARVAELLDGRTITTAESCTAGRVAEALATVERATEFFRGGIVAYQEWVKRDLLGVTASSVLSPEAAAQMAIGAARLMRAEVAVSTTGVAGGDGQEDTPPGTVYIATSVNQRVTTLEHHFDGPPEQVCDKARHQALIDLIAAMDTE